jgi:hypothetical protein
MGSTIASGLLAVLALPWLEGDLIAHRLSRAALSAFAACALALAAIWPARVALSGALGFAPPKLVYDAARQAALVDAFWAARREGPLRYQVSHFGGSGDRALGSSTAFFSKDRPSIFHAADLRRSPWVALADYRRHGGVLVSEPPIPVGALVAGLCVTDVARFERPTRYRGYRPSFFHVGLLPPSPEPRSSCP